jgi:hypothetical protein
MDIAEDIQRAVECVRHKDTFAAICELVRQKEPLDATATLADLANHLYWKEKDLPAAIAIGRAGIQFALLNTHALNATDASLAAKLRSAAKGMAFNLASFTWPGWDEPAIAITLADLAIGLDAAKLNLRLAIELNKGDLPLSRAHWMRAAHHLTLRQYPQAVDGFATAAEYAIKAASAADEFLCKAFECLANLAQRPSDAVLLTELSKTREKLRPLENGPGFIAQITTVARVIGLTLN